MTHIIPTMLLKVKVNKTATDFWTPIPFLIFQSIYHPHQLLFSFQGNIIDQISLLRLFTVVEQNLR